MAAKAAARKASPRRRMPGGSRKGRAPARSRKAGKGLVRRGKAKARRTAGQRTGPEAVAAHLARIPVGRREPMLRLWSLVQDALPGCTCLVSHGIAIAAVGGRWVAGVGGGKAHTALHLMSPDFVRTHAAELAGLDASGGTVRFALSTPLPAPLVRRLVRARLVSLGRPYGAGAAGLQAPRMTSKPPAPSPRPTPLDRLPKPMVVPLDKPLEP